MDTIYLDRQNERSHIGYDFASILIMDVSTDPRVSTTCRQCGARVSEADSFCPHCGQRVAPAFDRMREPAGGRRAERSLGDGIGLSRPTPLFAPAGASAGAGAYNEERQTKRPVPRQWRLNHTGGIALIIFVLLFGAYALMTQHANRTSSREEPLHTVIGQVTPSRGSNVSANAAPAQETAKNQATGTQALSTNIPESSLPPAAPLQEPPQPAASLTAPSIAPPVAQQQLPTPSNSSAAPLQESPQPATSLPAPPAAPPIAQQPQAPAPSAKDHASAHVAQQPPAPAPSAKAHVRAPAASQQRLADNRSHADARSAAAPATHEPQDNNLTAPYLATARSDLDENNLAGARAALSKALDKAPANSDALMLRQDLASREHARDAALNKARACLEQHQWKCAWHSAGNALSIDSSSTEASALEQRSLVNWGETNQAEGQSPNTSP
ncbi:zinc-ribbon domain-containing protein [Trinickia sp. YCB016]